MADRKVLIKGGAGFIGWNFINVSFERETR